MGTLEDWLLSLPPELPTLVIMTLFFLLGMCAIMVSAYLDDKKKEENAAAVSPPEDAKKHENIQLK